MDEIKIQYIERLIEERKKVFLGGLYNLFIHSILNTVNIYHLIEYILTAKSDTDIYRSIESNAVKRLELGIDNEELFEFFIQKFTGAKYHKKQRIRKLLVLITKQMDISYKYRCFDVLYNSKYLYDKKAALAISKEIWDDSFNEMVLFDYLELKEEFILKIYLDNGDINLLVPYLENIWHTKPKNYLKIKIIHDLSSEFFSAFWFLKELEPEKYLMAMSYSNEKFSDNEIINCFNNIDDELKPFGLMSLGRLGKWNSLEYEIQKYIN